MSPQVKYVCAVGTRPWQANEVSQDLEDIREQLDLLTTEVIGG